MYLRGHYKKWCSNHFLNPFKLMCQIVNVIRNLIISVASDVIPQFKISDDNPYSTTHLLMFVITVYAFVWKSLT